MQRLFYEQIKKHISSARLGAYTASSADGQIDPEATLARYMLNVSLCESLYPALQNCEIALRNAIHQHLSNLMEREDWYNFSEFVLTPWGQKEISKAKAKLEKFGKVETPGSVVAELQFGFWSSLFEAHYEQNTAFLPGGFKAVFPHMNKSLHTRKDRKNDLNRIRTLRNRVFHHERIVHWTDLSDQHQLTLAVIGWISPSLRAMTGALDRFNAVRSAGLTPFLDHPVLCAQQTTGAGV